jgi:hypothetical protein
VKVDLAGAQAVVSPAPGKSFDPTKIPKAVKDAGFTPGTIEVNATGTLSLKDGLLMLEMAAPPRRFALAGGARAGELRERSDLLGKRLRVTGELHPSHADRPSGLTVEAFEPLEAGPAAREKP